MTNTLIIGGHGKVSLLATPKLVDNGIEVTSLIRNADQASDIEALGATPLIRDVTEITPSEWDNILSGYDVVIWSAGNGGRGGADVTYAVDRDAALTVIDSLERLKDLGKAPRFLNVSYADARNHSVPEDDSFHPYADAKKTVDDRLTATRGLDYLILGPATLTEEPSAGFAPFTRDIDRSAATTSRELVADALVEFTQRDDLPENRTVEFVDGTAPVDRL